LKNQNTTNTKINLIQEDCLKGRIGYAPGAFDLFHIGHLNLLQQARNHCDYLIAGVVSDDILLIKKGITPIIPLVERLEIVRSVRFVDEGIAETVFDKLEVWKKVKFDVLFKGDDWCGTPDGDRLERELAVVGVKVIYFPYTTITSSTSLRQTLANINNPGRQPSAPSYAYTSLSYLKPRFQRSLRPLTKMIARAGITANQVTLTALLGSLIVGALLTVYHKSPAIFALLPVWLFIRMGFNTIDGLLALEHGQKSRLGGFMNEAGDIVSDFALAVPLISASSFSFTWITIIMSLAVLNELTGIAGSWFGGERNNDGPFGKSDRAIAFSIISVCIAINGHLPAQATLLLPLFIFLHFITIVNRLRYTASLAKKKAKGHIQIENRSLLSNLVRGFMEWKNQFF
jgi:glycerol-3-phosphate cytidylyltransferase